MHNFLCINMWVLKEEWILDDPLKPGNTVKGKEKRMPLHLRENPKEMYDEMICAKRSKQKRESNNVA